MHCLGCGSESVDNFCPACGKQRANIIKNVKEFPEEIRLGVERLNLVVSDYMAPPEERHGDGHLEINSLKDVHLEGDYADLVNTRIYSAGSVTFSPTKTKYFFKFYYDGQEMSATAFYSNVAFARVWNDDEKCIRVYSDYHSHDISSNCLMPTKMKSVSRKPVFVTRFGDLFYLYTPNETEGYLSVDGRSWPHERIYELPINEEVRVGSNASFVIGC